MLLPRIGSLDDKLSFDFVVHLRARARAQKKDWPLYENTTHAHLESKAVRGAAFEGRDFMPRRLHTQSVGTPRRKPIRKRKARCTPPRHLRSP